MPEGMSFVAIFDWVKSVSSFLIAIAAIVGFIKPIRVWLINKVRHWAGYKENTERDDRLDESIGIIITRLDEFENESKNQWIATNDCLNEIRIQQKRTEEFEKRELRAQIVHIYYKYLEDKKLPAKQKKVLCEKYEMYVEEYDGNSYVQELFAEMKLWPTYS